ncbi:hypothetical protein, partial [Chromobacterium violaceum]|uniref:hypothetical protein n=1 Tax=Chromobacterium violaceum TaxID=536 RepID=UPI001C3849F7
YVVITGTVSFPLFRSLRQLRRRTIPAPPPSVNRFFEKMRRFSPIAAQHADMERNMKMNFLFSFLPTPRKGFSYQCPRR